MKNILGIDIGAHSIKFAEFDGTSITKLFMADTPDGLIKEGRITSFDVMADFIKETLAINKVKTKLVSIILSENDVYLRRCTIPYMDDKQIGVNLPYEFRDYLTDDKSNYYFAYRINDTIKDEEDKPISIDITASAVTITTIDSYRSMLKKAGLQLKYAIPNECSYVSLIQANNEITDKEFAFFDIGHENCRLDIFTSIKYETTRIIDKGLHALDMLISENEHVDEHVASTYKEVNYNNILSSESVINFFLNVATEVRRSLNFYSLNNRNSTLNDFYFVSGGSNITQLNKAIADQIDISVHNITELYPPVVGDYDNLPTYAHAIGAAISSDCLNLAVKEKSPFRLKFLIPVLIGALLIIGLIGKFGIIDRYNKLYELQAQQAELESTNIMLSTKLIEYDNVLNEYNKYSTKFLSEDEQYLVLKSDVLSLIESSFMKSGQVSDILSSGNTVTLDVSNITLDDTSKLINSLNLRDDVVAVSLTKAESVEQNENNGDNTTDTVNTPEATEPTTTTDSSLSNITLTIVMTNGKELETDENN